MESAIRSPGRAILGVVFLGLSTYGCFLGRTVLANPDEPRYALVAREMLEGSDWIVPHLNGKIYAEKPPIFFWAIAATGKLWGGVDEVSARLPSVLAAVGLLLVTFLIGRRLFPDRERGAAVGLLAAGILGTNTRFLVLASRANIDCLLTFWTTAAFLCFLEGFPLEPAGRVVRRGWVVGAFALAALAVLTKGVGGPLFLLVLLVYFPLRRDWGALRQIPWLPGLAVFAALIAAWLVPARIYGGEEYFQRIAFKQTVTRVFDPFTHVRPFYFYFTTLPGNFLPWTLYVPLAGTAIVRAFTRRDPAPPEERSGLIFPVVAFLTMFLVFSASPTKRDFYLLPAFPWLSLAVAWGVERAFRAAVPGSAWSTGTAATAWTLTLAGALAGALVAAWSVLPPEWMSSLTGGRLAPDVAAELAGPTRWLGLALAAGMAGSGFLLRRRRWRDAWVAVVLACVVGWGIYRGVVRPAYRPALAQREMGERLAAHTTPQDTITLYAVYEDAVPFYAHRIVRWLDPMTPEEVAQVLLAPGRTVLLTPRKIEEVLRRTHPELALTELDHGPLEDEPCVILVNR